MRRMIIQPGVFPVRTFFSSPCRVFKVGGGLLILLVCAINMYFVVTYVAALHSVWLYVLAALLSIAYLTFVGYLVGSNFIHSKLKTCESKLMLVVSGSDF